jgi:TolB-like protein
VAEHEGRIVKLMGDGVLVEFASAVNAVSCAIELQKNMLAAGNAIPEERRVAFRIGINLGDVVVEGDDLYGDGVNLAARLQELAEPGGICVSAKVREEVGRKIDIGFEDFGEQQLKNIATPVRVYMLRPALFPPAVTSQPLPLPDKPSIAVLPFQNLSGDSEQEYFADGMVEEIIAALSRMRWLFVIARNSSFTYKGRAVDVKQVGRELGVRYVLEGSVRKAGTRVRIAGELIDTSTGANLWADRFEGSLEDVFDLQDQVTASVVGAIAPKLEQAEIERAERKPTESLDAYDCYLRGMAGYHRWTREGNDNALSHFYRATELDRNFAPAYGMAARCYVQRKGGNWMADRAREVSEARRLARRAEELGKDNPAALWTAGWALAYVVGELEDGDALIDRALALNPNLTLALAVSGWVKVWLGDPEAAIEREKRAMRLSPQDTELWSMHAATACAHFFAGRYAEACSLAEIAMRENANAVPSPCIAAASSALAGRLEDAHMAMARVRQLDPDLRLSNLMDLFPIRRFEDFARWQEGMRKAGLPE